MNSLKANLSYVASVSALLTFLSGCEVPVSTVSASSTEVGYTQPPASGGAGSQTGGTISGGAPSDTQPVTDNPWDVPYDNGSNPYNRVTDSFSVINHAKPVDVLFVMDNSGSMAEEQQQVVNSFSTFLEGFVAERIDYHIGVITTDSYTDPNWWSPRSSNAPYNNFPNAGPGSLLAYTGNPRFISTQNSRTEVIRQFRQNALLGTGGSGAETGLFTATKALGDAMTTGSGWNAGFLRADSLLEIVIVSDEDEAVGNNDARYLKNVSTANETTRINNFIDRLKTLRPNRPDLTRVDFIIGPNDPNQSCATALQKGDTYTKTYNLLYPVANANNGKIMNICTNFAPELGALGAQIAMQVERRFKVSKNVDGALIVKLDGVEISVSTSQGYTYNIATQEIEIHGMDLENKDTFAVSVEYVSKK